MLPIAAGEGSNLTRVLVLGGSGMLGHKMAQVLDSRFPPVRATVRAMPGELPPAGPIPEDRLVPVDDLADTASVESLIDREAPEVVVNCVGVIKQRASAREAIPSITINALLPHQLAEICAAGGIRLIHFSTDCVFSGDRGNYTEDDFADARDLYGRTKYLGEVDYPGTLTLRTSIVGRELSQFRSLVEWFLAQRDGTVPGYTRAMYSGLTTNRMASLVGDLIEHHADLTGVYHVAGPVISKYDLLVLLDRAFRRNVTVVADDTVVIDRTLNAGRFAAATGYTPPSWEEMVEEMAADPTPYERWRT